MAGSGFTGDWVLPVLESVPPRDVESVWDFLDGVGEFQDTLSQTRYTLELTISRHKFSPSFSLR